MSDAAGPGTRVTCQEVVELVTRYLEHDLDAAAHAEVEAHLALCDGCATYLEQMRQTIRLLGRVPVDSLSEPAQRDLVSAFRELRRAAGEGASGARNVAADDPPTGP
jgi:anti-sigma factor RsiW